MSRKCLYLLGKFMDCMSITQTFNLDFFSFDAQFENTYNRKYFIN